MTRSEHNFHSPSGREQPPSLSQACWKGRPSPYMLHYPVDTSRLRQLPPLVFSAEIQSLKTSIELAQKGEAFILHGGDCAERFIDCRADVITQKLKILLQMSALLSDQLGCPLIPIARMAGQYTKPRENQYEKDGVTLNYHGDMVHDFFDRKIDPSRIEQAYWHSSATLNFMRALLSGGFGKNAKLWHLRDFPTPIPLTQTPTFDQVFTSHEALFLPYEEALTRPSPIDGKIYDYSAHFLWLGYRTYRPDWAYVDFLSHIHNPVGIKIGAATDPALLKETIRRLNPRRDSGKLCIISRMGLGNIDEHLPKFLKYLEDEPLCWMIDPMHGNTIKTESGHKTRYLSTITAEIEHAIKIHAECKIPLSGLSLEISGDHVSECIDHDDNPRNTSDSKPNYQSYCDPRLNYSQAMNLASLSVSPLKQYFFNFYKINIDNLKTNRHNAALF